MSFFVCFFSDRRGNMAETAIALPVLLLVSLGLINLALFGIAGANANNAANYGARLGAVAQKNQVALATNAAYKKLTAAPVGTYAVSAEAPGQPGSMVAVRVTYTVPNYFQGLTGFFGVRTPPNFQQTAVSYFRQEGWTP